jgi:tetratricopeptide (TPR) repeat protein
LASIRWDDAPLDWNRPLPTGETAEAGYVGSQVCKSCHDDLYASWSRHSMAKSGIRPLASLDRRWLDKIFDGAPAVLHAKSGFRYQPSRRGRDYFLDEEVVDAAGKIVQSRRVQVTHALSAGSYGMAFYFRRGGHLFQTPLDYYPQVKRWDLDPGAAGGNPRFTKTLRGFCISCHSDYPRRSAGSDARFVEPMPPGIGCERCHGPGQKHASSGRKEDVVNPARLPVARQMDVCAQCHLSAHHELRAGASDFGFRPGGVLEETRLTYVAATPEPDRIDLLGHSERMVRSTCWKKSKMTCTSCHDPHKSSLEQPARWWDEKCVACHRERGCTADAATRAAEGDHCARCHMRAGPPIGPTQVTVTDHWIQRRPPPRRPGSSPTDRLVTWASLLGESDRGDDLPALEALALSEIDHNAEAERLAARAAESRPRVPRLYEWLASRCLKLRQPAQSARALATLLGIAPDERDALDAYARAMLDTPEPGAAEEALHAIERMIALDPEDADALELQGLYRFRAGRLDEAKAPLQRAAEAGTAQAAAHVALALLADRAGHGDEALAELEAARAVEPGDPWVLEKLAARYAAAHDAAHADEIARAQKHFSVENRRGPASAWLPAGYR